MKVRLLTDRWDQRTPKGIVRRRRDEQFTVKDDIAEWLIQSGSAEQVGRATAATAAAPADAVPAGDDVIAELEAEAEVDAAAEDEGDEPEPDDGDGEDDDAATGAERPAQSAPKAEWVAYAVSRGIPAKEAEGMDKTKLISRTA